MKKREILLGNPAFKKFNRTLMIIIKYNSPIACMHSNKIDKQ